MEIQRKANLLHLLKPYWKLLLLLIILTLVSNLINLYIPRIIAASIDDYIGGDLKIESTVVEFLLAMSFILILSYFQGVTQTYTSEQIGMNLRAKLSDMISEQDYIFIEQTSSGKLLTNFTADVDAIKRFSGQAISEIISAIFTCLGASILLISINWKLALCVIAVIPIISTAFFMVQSRVKNLYNKSRYVIDWLNKVIEETILGSNLVRVVNSGKYENDKFLKANEKALEFGFSTLRPFTKLIPLIPFTSNIATLVIVLLGGHYVITDEMSLGDLTAFNSYVSMVLFPVLLVCGMSNNIAETSTSYTRIVNTLQSGKIILKKIGEPIFQGAIEMKGVNKIYGQKTVLRDVSLKVSSGAKVAIVGPLAAGKTQLLYLLSGLIKPSEGTVAFDGKDIETIDSQLLTNYIGFVFQDSIIFNMSIRENIAFSDNVSDVLLQKAVETAELKEFIDSLPEGLETLVSERGSRLSGGQKQRIMLARALAINPKVLLLDDFVARVDTYTGNKILQNISMNYPKLTLISVTQKISTVTNYDQIILLIQGEVIGIGRHEQLIEDNADYYQLYNSQKSTATYEL